MGRIYTENLNVSSSANLDTLNVSSGANLASDYKGLQWTFFTDPDYYYASTTGQTSTSIVPSTTFSQVPSSAKALYVTYFYHISGYATGTAGQGDHASDLWGPVAPATSPSSWSFTTSGDFTWGMASFMHDGDASESGDIAYYGQWYPGAIIGINSNGNMYALLSHGYSGGTHYHHMYVWGYIS